MMPSSSKTTLAVSTAAVGAAGLFAGLFLSKSRAPREVRHLLKGNWALLSSQERSIATSLAAVGQGHLLKGWPSPGVKDGEKKRLLHAAASSIGDSMTEADQLESARLALLVAPAAPKRPKELLTHGDVRIDDYYWFRDDSRTNPEVIEHLKSETAYCKAALADTEALQERLYQEMRGRIQETDESAPQRYEGWYYYSRTLEGQQYRVRCRRQVPSDASPHALETDVMDSSLPEQILLDENAEATKHSFYMVGGFEVSPDHKLLAYADDTVGGEKFTLHVKDLATGRQLLSTPIAETAGRMAWANDNKTLFYVTKDSLDRPFKVWRHVLGSKPTDDALVFHETDDAFYVGLGRQRSEQMLTIHSGSAVTSEVRYLDANKPQDTWQVVLPRVNDVEYDVDHRRDHFFITLRDQKRPNSELLVAPVADPTNTTVILAHSADTRLESVEVSEHYLTVFARSNGLQHATVYRLPAGSAAPTELSDGKELKFDEPAYSLSPGSQGDFASDILRFVYGSLTTPPTTTDHNMISGQRAMKRVLPVLGGFDKANYKTERLWAKASDGTSVPISLVYRPDMVKQDGNNPCLLYAYGSYEISIDADFSANRLALLDRGFVWAIAHVRGGGDMGRLWYENGKYLQKKNTFTDYITCAEHLISEKWTRPEKLCAEGRSAGGLTMGALVTMRPDLVNAVILGVPFVDVVTTMLDDTIPLTSIEWEEWGNPANEEYYHYMKSYSPIDNVQPGTKYPNILVTGGLHDPRVAYWEPAKFVAKLRAANVGDDLMLFKCDMGAGHFSQSGRFDRLKELAIEYAFLLKCQGLKKT